ncbi:MAG TPA: amidohydrolase family protein [Nitrososphaerales archaeon]|nr:amidohydrolase family protein [Nitrososphaerales archaeon]
MLELTNCNVIDIESGKTNSGASVLIDGPHIKEVLTDGGGKSVTTGNVIDMRDSFLLPGLFNCHTHLSLPFPHTPRNPQESEASVSLRCFKRAMDVLLGGVTTVRTVGEVYRCDIALRDAINSKILTGPRIVAGGRGIRTSFGQSSPTDIAVQADGAENCQKAARSEISLGAQHLKIFATGGLGAKGEDPENQQMTKEEMQAVASVCKSRNTYVTAHCGGSSVAIDAVEAGVTCLEHGYVLNNEAVEKLAKVKGYLDPTLCVTRSEEWYRWYGFEEPLIEKALAYHSRHVQSLKNAVSAGVKIVLGTDIPPGDENEGTNATIREVEYLCKDGSLPEIEALKAATVNSATLCGLQNQTGLIREGYFADIIAVAENPLSDIRNLRKVVFVMKEGDVVRNDLKKKLA